MLSSIVFAGTVELSRGFPLQKEYEYKKVFG